MTVLNIALVLATLGFQNALPREVAFYREREPSRVRDLVSTALVIVAANSLVWTAVLFAGAGSISRLFGDERLVRALRIVVFALPFWALTGVVISVSRGFGRVREQVYFRSIIYPVLWLIFVLVLALLRLSFSTLFYLYVLLQSLLFFALLLEVQRVGIIRIGLSFNHQLGMKLVIFSAPLMFVGILNFLMTWTDTLMLGHYLGSTIVGLYNAASPLARLIPIFLGAAGVIYTPIITPLYAQGKIKEMGRVYQILTKWIFLLTLPLFAMLFFFPEITISFLFGGKYIAAAQALRILSLGFMFHTFLGLNGLTLIAIGKPKLNMIGDSFAAVSNVVLNLLLIPTHGMAGAAVATAVSYFVANLFRSFWLYKMTGVHPFGRSYVKPLVIGFVMIGLFWGSGVKASSIWHALAILVVFMIVYYVMVLLSRSIDKEDVELFLTMEKKLGIDLRVIKKFLRRFV